MESDQHWVEQTANKLHCVVGYSHCFGRSSGLLHPCSWLEQLPGPWVRAAVQAALRSDWSHADTQSRHGDSNSKVIKCHPASKEQWEWEDAQGLMAMMQCCRSAGGNCSSSSPGACSCSALTCSSSLHWPCYWRSRIPMLSKVCGCHHSVLTSHVEDWQYEWVFGLFSCLSAVTGALDREFILISCFLKSNFSMYEHLLFRYQQIKSLYL